VAHKYISVIVIAYNRRKYLLQAVRSALQQTLPKDLYEVIVVKNFRDETIDRRLEEWGVANMYSDDTSQGGKIYEALEVARGEVISILEDDDEFLPEKLAGVYAAFKSGADYYHNGFVLVNERGEVLAKRGLSQVAKRDEEKVRYAMQGLIHDALGNSSAISVRKSILEKIELKKCELSLDALMLTAGLLLARIMVDDPRHLTVFRVHSQHLSFDLSSFEVTHANALKIYPRILSDAAYLMSIVRGSPYERVVKYYTFLPQKLSWLALPERPQLGDPELDSLRPSDVLEWITALPYFRHHLRFFAIELLAPVLPKAFKRALAKFEFKWSALRILE